MRLKGNSFVQNIELISVSYLAQILKLFSLQNKKLPKNGNVKSKKEQLAAKYLPCWVINSVIL